ncbi:MAG: hypothetical protein CMJ84_14605 [Planctomycetes bacterium]|jgi:hypothetical protein|nr:hypothetical protein [Planctomycetota bacterium]
MNIMDEKDWKDIFMMGTDDHTSLPIAARVLGTTNTDELEYATVRYEKDDGAVGIEILTSRLECHGDIQRRDDIREALASLTEHGLDNWQQCKLFGFDGPSAELLKFIEENLCQL